MSGYKFREAINDLTKFANNLEVFVNERFSRNAYQKSKASISQSQYDDARTKLREVIDDFTEWRDRLIEDGKEGTPFVESIQDTIDSINVEGLSEFPDLDNRLSVISAIENIREIIEELNDVQFPSR